MFIQWFSPLVYGFMSYGEIFYIQCFKCWLWSLPCDIPVLLFFSWLSVALRRITLFPFYKGLWHVWNEASWTGISLWYWSWCTALKRDSTVLSNEHCCTEYIISQTKSNSITLIDRSAGSGSSISSTVWNSFLFLKEMEAIHLIQYKWLITNKPCLRK